MRIHQKLRAVVMDRGPFKTPSIIIGAHIVQAYERKGHWYQILDGMVTGEGNRELARLRHTTIFRPRGTETPPPIVTES